MPAFSEQVSKVMVRRYKELVCRNPGENALVTR